jgi:hypothetical protein
MTRVPRSARIAASAVPLTFLQPTTVNAMHQNLRLVHLLIALFVCVIASVIVVTVMHAEQKVALAAGPNAPVAVAGVTYRAQASRAMDEAGDAAALRALPRRLRHPSSADVLYGVFVSATNSSDATHQLARRFELIDANMRPFAPLPLAAGSAYRYRPSQLPPGARVPANGSPAAQNLAEQGYPLVFRLPRAAYLKRLTLRIFDPTGSTPPGEIVVQS